MPIPSKVNNIIMKINSFRKNKDQYRIKCKEIMKLRDTNMNFDNEVYENV